METKAMGIVLGKIVLSALLAWFAFCGWAIIGMIFSFGSLRPGFMVILCLIFVLGWSLLLMRRIWGVRWFTKAGLTGLILPIVLWGSVTWYDWWTRDRFEKLENRVNWREYKPFDPASKLVKTCAPEEFRCEGKMPQIKCAYALYPIGAAAYEALATPSDSVTVHPVSSPDAYEALRFGANPWGADVILALAPSSDDRAEAEKQGLSYEQMPIAKDAFVFIVPVSNPVESLSSEQIRGIYSGKITSWRELGVELDAKLLPYQRNKGSGSQTALERLMGETPIMEPIKEDKLRGMGGIISATADYRNYPGALGFTFRYYVNELVKDRKVKLLKIDGVEPNVENIRSGRYPFVETAYAITVRPREGNVRRFVDFLTSPAGRSLVEETGYVSP